MGRHRHIVMVEEPHRESFAAGVLLRKSYSMYEVQRWLDAREGFLTKKRAAKGSLECYYCGSNNLLMSVEEPVTKAKLRLLATVDHVHPISKGGAKWDEKNWVVACHPCNQNKADTVLTDDSERSLLPRLTTLWRCLCRMQQKQIWQGLWERVRRFWCSEQRGANHVQP